MAKQERMTSSSRRNFGLRLGALVVAAASGPGARAQAPALPQGPVRLIVPFTPGTGIDIVARTLSPRLSERLGRPVVVDNRAGASGNIGTQAAVNAPADGSTLLVTVSTLVMNASLYPTLPFDPLKDLVPVALTSWGQLLLVANPKTGFNSTADLLAAARQSPEKIDYGSPGAGTPHHLAMELLKNKAGISLTHIPYRGTAPAVTDLLGGQIDVMFLPIHVALPHVKAGRLSALGIGSDKRHPLLPDVPTVSEANVGSVNVDMWFGLFAPSGTPADLVTMLNREVNGILSGQEVAQAFSTQGMDPSTATPEEFRKLVESDAKRWADLIATQKITAE
jgi:tripartite-type tricarboxylate transporter receptor subunit TctC